MIHAMMARTVRTMPINQTCIGRIMALAHLWASTRILPGVCRVVSHQAPLKARGSMHMSCGVPSCRD